MTIEEAKEKLPAIKVRYQGKIHNAYLIGGQKLEHAVAWLPDADKEIIIAWATVARIVTTNSILMEDTMRVTLTNNFHNTTTTVITTDGKLTRRQVRRAYNRLCGQEDCLCGGARPSQIEQIDNDRWQVIIR